MPKSEAWSARPSSADLPETTITVSADDMRRAPWRYPVGAAVYLHGQPLDRSFLVIGGELWCSFPHYLVRDTLTGDIWLTSQLRVSSKAVVLRKV